MIKYRLTVLVALSIVASGTLNFAHVVLIDSDVDARLTAWLLWAVSGFGAIGLYWAVAIPLLNSRNNRAYNPVSDPPKTSATTINPEFEPPPIPLTESKIPFVTETSDEPKIKQSFRKSLENAHRQAMVWEGRATRFEYWSYQTYALLIYVIILMAFGAELLPKAVAAIFVIGFLLGNISVAIRRLHDINWNGATLLFLLGPVIGLLFILILLCTRGTKGYNKYGPDPLVKHTESPPPIPTESTQDLK